jgi:hypothetical protein
MKNLEWLDKYWNYYIGEERVGQFFCREMSGYKFRSAKEIINHMKEVMERQ